MAGFLDDLLERGGRYTTEENTVARCCFNTLLRGAAPSIPNVLRQIGIPAASGRNAIAALVRQGVLAVDDEVVTVARGLSSVATAHQLQMKNGPVVYACCAVDAIGIPAALGDAARVTSRCHACGSPIDIALAQGRVLTAPPAAIIWAADTDHGRSLREFT